MRLIILSIIATGLLLMAFDAKKCDHVFTNVVQPEIKVSTGSSNLTVYPVGKLDGPDLICVKCFHRQKQIVDYGAPVSVDFNNIYFNRFRFDTSVTSTSKAGMVLQTGSVIRDTSSKVVYAY